MKLLRSALWIPAIGSRPSAAPLMLLLGLLIFALALIYFSPPRWAELSRVVAPSWSTAVCQQSGRADCRLEVELTSDPPSAPRILSIDASGVRNSFNEALGAPGRALSPARLTFRTNLSLDELRAAALAVEPWPRVRRAIENATVEPLKASPAKPVRRKQEAAR